MDKTLRMYLLILIAVIALLIFVDMTRTKPVNWAPTYSLDHKNPLDLFVFNHEVETIIPKKRLHRVTVSPYEYLQHNDEPQTYMMIRQYMFSLSDTVLLNAVYKGSTLFLSAENYVGILTDTLHLEYGFVDLNGSLKKQQRLILQLTNGSWHHHDIFLRPVLNNYAFTKADPKVSTILGTETMPDGFVSPNFIRVKYGAGYVFIHNQPQVFTNVALLGDNSTAKYVEHLLSYLPKKQDVVWFVNGQTVDPKSPENETSLSVIFRYPALRATWLILIYGLLVYIIFNAKRRQRVVPVEKPLENTTVEFVQTIGNLYLQEGNVYHMIQKKILFFLDRIRNQYYLDTTILDQHFAEKLILKSGKNEKLIEDILRYIRYFQTHDNAQKEDLLKLNKLMEEFWEKN